MKPTPRADLESGAGVGRLAEHLFLEPERGARKDCRNSGTDNPGRGPADSWSQGGQARPDKKDGRTVKSSVLFGIEER